MTRTWYWLVEAYRQFYQQRARTNEKALPRPSLGCRLLPTEYDPTTNLLAYLGETWGRTRPTGSSPVSEIIYLVVREIMISEKLPVFYDIYYINVHYR